MELILQQQLPHQQKAIDAIVDVFEVLWSSIFVTLVAKKIIY